MDVPVAPSSLNARAHAPVSHLPAEVLVRVFAYARLFEPPGPPRHYPFYQPGCIGWVKVSHVCRGWRHVALGAAHLWENVDFTMKEEWAQAFLARSQNAPIVLTFGPRPHVFTDLHVKLIAMHISHTRELFIGCQETTVVRSQLFNRLTTPAPILESIYCMLADDPPVPLPEDLLAQDAPRLSCVTFANCGTLPWTSRLFTNLTTLIAPRPRGLTSSAPEYVPPNLFDVLDALERMPTLCDLTLFADAVVRPADLPFPHGHSVVHLPNLEMFSVESNNLPDMTALLRYLCLPPKVHVDISMQGGGESSLDPLDEFFSVLGGLLRGCAPITKLCVSDGQKFMGFYEFTAFRDEPDEWKRMPHVESLSLRMWVDVWPEAVVMAFCSALQKDALRTLDMYLFQGWTGHGWFDAFGEFDALREITAKSDAAISLFRTLAASDGFAQSWLAERQSRRGPGGAAVPFPQLESVTAYQVNFRKCPSHDRVFCWKDLVRRARRSVAAVSHTLLRRDVEGDAGDLYPNHINVAKWLKTRQQGSAPLRTLLLDHCTLPSNGLKREFGGLVPQYDTEQCIVAHTWPSTLIKRVARRLHLSTRR
ncbi:hypothetical protein FA95DRAFT_1569694 [Auriscalpium vulgare]|uniref:Uncharacterized protein n=1 Tax=Auriscalpium vulgare TaxID=40419 RepID=A0ACB8S6R0_9AGAM|nr:hypothetical protein FA95DRAFT_1569694 [Auriscalpium vulgare]